MRNYELLMKDPAELSNADLVAIIEERYGEYEVPPCRVCGAPLAIARMGGGSLAEYACSSKEASDSVYATPYREDNHYNNSHWKAPNHPDAHIRELVERFERLREDTAVV